MLEMGNADPLSQRRKDGQGFLRDAFPFFLTVDIINGAHVMGAVSELDDQHADILTHGQNQFAKVFSLLVVRLHLNPGQLGHAINKPGNFIGKFIGDGVERNARILNHIMQEGGDDAGLIKPHIRQNIGNLERVGNVGVARCPQLAVMRLAGKFIRRTNHPAIHIRVVAFDLRDKSGCAVH